MLRSVVSLCDHRMHALDEDRRAFDQRDGERRPLIQVCGTDVDTVPVVDALIQHLYGGLIEIEGQVDLLCVGRCPAMKTQIASDLHLESLPGGLGISIHRDADTGAARVVERDSDCRLPASEAFVPSPDRDVLVLAGHIGTELIVRQVAARIWVGYAPEGAPSSTIRAN